MSEISTINKLYWFVLALAVVVSVARAEARKPTWETTPGYQEFKAWKAATPWWNTWIKAIYEKETSSGKNVVPGDNGKSNGPLQIQIDYWKDSGIYGTYADIMQFEAAEYCVYRYMRRYAPNALKKGDTWTLSTIHNGGPAGPRKPAAKAYALAVKKIAAQLQKPSSQKARSRKSA